MFLCYCCCCYCFYYCIIIIFLLLSLLLLLLLLLRYVKYYIFFKNKEKNCTNIYIYILLYMVFFFKCRRWLCFVYNWLVCTDGSCWTLIIGLYTGSHIWALTHCKHSSKSRGTLTVSPGAPPGTCSCSIRAVPSSSACKTTAVARRAEVLVMVSRPGSNPGLESPSLSGDNSASWSTAAEIILSVIVVARDSTAPKPIPGKE
ncbi:hypothetical protein AWRI1631_111940 [Saccharomyces cerevisiae AWRI1631]|uniref:Uncharacterized protein n=1 Tax=Saccharomyces cerevisiae (strain AWRI1631) TaxID=545124 RepID=B5VMC3_YEAS6|nr:hypothetical protein AWRI1631_111940 [Saccharomyces cerevisiae AWRI1631]